jgi:hypothetical protein
MRSLAMATYRAAARLFLPRALRDEYAHELEETVAARLAAAGSPFGRSLVLVAELGDLGKLCTSHREGAILSSCG